MNLDAAALASLRDLAVKAAREAGELVESRIGSGFEIEKKEAGETLASQVVTEVDRAAEAHLLSVLGTSCLHYDIGLLTEERIDDGSRFEKDYFWCIDPLDGTLPYVEGVEGYAVSVALVSQAGQSVIGVVYDPRSKVIYEAIQGQGCRIDGKDFRLATKRFDDSRLNMFSDRSFVNQAGAGRMLSELDAWAGCEGLGRMRTLFEGGAVMNACWALESRYGCYFKLPKREKGGGSVWDFAAMDCVFQESGGVVSDMLGAPLRFNPSGSCFMNEFGVLFSTHTEIFDCIRKMYTKMGDSPRS